ncbi:MAG: carboxypeptidase-like regulatory domain-containing protein [Candidatus Bathyarchaeota archaeon]|nr:carboxypeptidase-like regulatory domain-containing protein [Candidatus Bathyarchaeum sp.]
MKKGLTVFLATFYVCTLLVLVPAFGQQLTQDQLVVDKLQVSTISEGYILSKDSSYGTNDRNYLQNETLHVWAWSSKLNANEFDDHYCLLTLDKYEHKIFLNSNLSMSQPNSFTGSFDLTRLEKTGNWSVQIYLRTAPPKPETFEENDVIQVSTQDPKTHALTISSWPISDVSFTLNGSKLTTQFFSSLQEAKYTIAMPQNVTVNEKVYNFIEWENGATLQTRTIELTDDKIVTAYFVAQTETFSSTITGIVTDNRGNPITAAKITIVETNNSTFTASEPAGQYLFENLSEGTYTLKVEAEGYNTTLTAIGVEQNKDYTQNFALPLTATEDKNENLDTLQIILIILALIGTTGLLLLWRSRKRFMKKIKKTEYKKTLEKARITAGLEELDSLHQKKLLRDKDYEEMRKKLQEDLNKISTTKN